MDMKQPGKMKAPAQAKDEGDSSFAPPLGGRRSAYCNKWLAPTVFRTPSDPWLAPRRPALVLWILDMFRLHSLIGPVSLKPDVARP